MEDIKDMLTLRFNEINFSQAKDDVAPFIKDISELDMWCTEFFIQITQNIKE